MPTLLINSLRSWYRSNGDGDERRRIWKDLPAVGGFVFDLEHVCRSVPTTEHSGLSQASRRNPVVLCLTQKHSPKHPRPQSLSLTYSSSKRLLPGLASSSAASIFPSLHWNLAKVYITSFIFRAVMVLTQTDGPAWSFCHELSCHCEVIATEFKISSWNCRVSMESAGCAKDWRMTSLYIIHLYSQSISEIQKNLTNKYHI